MSDNPDAAKIQKLNDGFRTGADQSVPGRYIFTTGLVNYIKELEEVFVETVAEMVAKYDDFNADNDPHKEHDFGNFKLQGRKVFWKIDYYSNEDCQWGSDDPSDPKRSYRMLTVFLAEEY